MSDRLCREGGSVHVVDIPEPPEEPPEKLTCVHCGLVFIRDAGWTQGYRPVEDEH